MTLSLLFWVLMVAWLVFGLWRDYPSGAKAIGGHVLVFVLLAVLGWKVFGPAIRD